MLAGTFDSLVLDIQNVRTLSVASLYISRRTPPIYSRALPWNPKQCRLCLYMAKRSSASSTVRSQAEPGNENKAEGSRSAAKMNAERREPTGTCKKFNSDRAQGQNVSIIWN